MLEMAEKLSDIYKLLFLGEVNIWHSAVLNGSTFQRLKTKGDISVVVVGAAVCWLFLSL